MGTSCWTRIMISSGQACLPCTKTFVDGLEFDGEKPRNPYRKRIKAPPMKSDPSRQVEKTRVRDLGPTIAAPFDRVFLPQRRARHIDWLKEPVLAWSWCSAATTAIAQPFYVPSGSMQPTLAIGDLPWRQNSTTATAAIPSPSTFFGPTPTQPLAWVGLPQGRRCGRVPPAEPHQSDLCQTRDRPARRPHPDARRPVVDQRAAN